MDRVMVKFTFSVDGSIDAVFAVSTQLVDIVLFVTIVFVWHYFEA